ncbi:hypothetical protein, partial [Phenylobacterium sp.]|uniref:hypothetical protein n=1 Tax=Phenylobacterium sp. TaxID=1871053 RepID=UPI0025D2ACEC
VAQQNIFSEMFKELVAAKQLRRSNFDSEGKDSMYRGVQDDLSNFVEQDVVDSNTLGGTFADSNVFRRPENTARIISIVVNNTERTPVELVFESDKITHILNSNLSAPTASYPVALVSRLIEVFPTDVDSIVVNYYRQPASIFVTNVGDFQSGDVDRTSGPRLVAAASTAQSVDFANSGFVIPDVSACRNFELPEHYKNEIISEIAKMIGIRLRDQFITNFGVGQTTNE